ncbi:MAG: family 20 glycosylhydrolase [Micromonosporaceae bacterium]
MLADSFGCRADIVAAPMMPTYFDTFQAGDLPPAGKGKRVRLEDVAAFAPVPSGWPETAARHLICTQFQLWSEYIPGPRRLDYTAFPRGCVLAEVAWTGQPLIPGEPGTIPGSGDLVGWPHLRHRLAAHRRRLAAHRRRLGAHLRRLGAAGVECRRPDGPLPGRAPTETAHSDPANVAV